MATILGACHRLRHAIQSAVFSFVFLVEMDKNWRTPADIKKALSHQGLSNQKPWNILIPKWKRGKLKLVGRMGK